MEANYQPQTDLASILQTLRAYAPSQQQIPQATYQSEVPQANIELRAPPPQAADLEEGEYDPSAYDPSLPLITTRHPQAAHAQALNAQAWQPPPITETRHIPTSTTTSYPRPPLESTPTSKPPSFRPGPKKTHKPPASHPATIITWAPALRHVTGQTASNSEFVQRVRHLITTQNNHERQWWDGREGLKKRLAGREEGRKKLDSVLGSLGGHVATSSKSDELSEEQELKIYDKKVYNACKEMGAATVKELKKLEVPFFCIMEGLVSPKGDGKAEEKKGTISEAELAEMRGRMMVLLEDLCGEE